jgi:hypothetical protein
MLQPNELEAIHHARMVTASFGMRPIVGSVAATRGDESRVYALAGLVQAERSARRAAARRTLASRFTGWLAALHQGLDTRTERPA